MSKPKLKTDPDPVCLSLMVPATTKDKLADLATVHQSDMNKVANLALRAGLPLVEEKLRELFGVKAA